MATPEQRWLAADACRDQLLRTGVRAGLTRHEAEEVASEAIIRAAQKADLDIERVHSWLKVVSNNLATDLVRRRRGSAWLTRLHHFEPESVSPYDRVDDISEAQWVAGVIAQLPPRQRLVLEQRAAGRSPGEIAQIMGCTDSIVESLTSRARRTVRTALAATLAALSPVIVWLRRGGPATAVPALALASTLGMALPLLVNPSDINPPRLDRGTVGDARVHLSATTDGPSQRAIAGAGFRKSTTSTSAPASSGAEGIAGERRRLGAIDAGVASYDGAEQTRTEEDRTLTESLVDCVKRGVMITLAHVGCREDEQRRNGPSPAYSKHETNNAADDHDHNDDLLLPGPPGPG